MQRNLTVKAGNCNHCRYIPKLVGLVATGALDPTEILIQTEPLTGAIEAYETFDRRRPGWLKVELDPAA
jgi:threonine dehydrogenase-like Zn-dependent dehydrogenase